MNKTTIVLASLCAISFCTCEVCAMIPQREPMNHEITTLPYGYEKILLQGELMLNIGPNAIEAGVNATEVYIQFNQSFGSVSISLYNGSNTLVYHATVNTDVQPIVIIPLNGADEGSYFLEIDSVSGSSEGGFDHTNN